MLKSIGIIGYGFVGKSCHYAFRNNTQAIIVDPAYSTTTITKLVAENPTMIFVAINAPTLDDRTVDATVIYSIFQQLADLKYTGLVVLRSTLPPDIVYGLYELYGSDQTLNKVGPLRYVYSPEFLREATWQSDAVNPQMIIFAGSYFDCVDVQTLYEQHSHITGCKFIMTDFKTAALLKYTINSFLAMKVVFMNQLHQLMLDTSGDSMQPEMWDEFVELLQADERIGLSHLAVPGPDRKYGYGGKCFPKDVSAMIGFDIHKRLSVLREVEISNTKIRLKGEL